MTLYLNLTGGNIELGRAISIAPAPGLIHEKPFHNTFIREVDIQAGIHFGSAKIINPNKFYHSES